MEHCRHPLDNIYPDNSLVLLEAMIPYVEPRMRLPLALLIKFQEIQFILTAFHNPQMMKICGLDHGASSTEDMLLAICQSMGFDIAEQLNTVQAIQSMQNMQNFQNMANMQNNSYEQAQQPMDDFSYTRDEMMDAIRDILANQNPD